MISDGIFDEIVVDEQELGGTEERSSTVLVAKEGPGGASGKARFNGQRAGLR
jgi:hypothetical protein